MNGSSYTVQVIDSVDDYVELMKSIFDFSKLRSLVSKGTPKSPFRVLIDSMHGGTSQFFFIDTN